MDQPMDWVRTIPHKSKIVSCICNNVKISLFSQKTVLPNHNNFWPLHFCTIFYTMLFNAFYIMLFFKKMWQFNYDASMDRKHQWKEGQLFIHESVLQKSTLHSTICEALYHPLFHLVTNISCSILNIRAASIRIPMALHSWPHISIYCLVFPCISLYPQIPPCILQIPSMLLVFIALPSFPLIVSIL